MVRLLRITSLECGSWFFFEAVKVHTILRVLICICGIGVLQESHMLV